MAFTQGPGTLDTCKLFISGKPVDSISSEFARVANPSNGQIIARVPMCSAQEVDHAVQAAHNAFPSWSQTPVIERARIMAKFKTLLENHYAELARSISREHGKTLSESRASLSRGIEVVEFALGIPSLIMGECQENIASGVDCRTDRHPLGVCAGITPFNFPAMVPLWMYPVAITCGNTFVLKPSEKVPLTNMMIAELLNQAGLPAGVFNIVHGGKAAVDALLEHPLVKAVSFVGSTAVARYIYEVACKNGKRVQSAGGAKNHMIIMPDADLDQTVQAVQTSAFGCAGERCMAGSLAIPVGHAADMFIPLLIQSAKAMKVGRTDTDSIPDMGPLISAEHLSRVKSLIAAGIADGGETVLDGRSIAVSDAPDGFYLGPTIVDNVKPGTTLVKEEVFGPVLGVVRVNTLEEAISLGNDCPYGNGAVIFTTSGRAAREFKCHFNAGMIGVNVGVPAPMSWFPFTGWNNSFFGDLHIQGRESIYFYTQQKMTMTRWFSEQKITSKFQDPVWQGKG